ncbi:MAG: efflux RND transporter periplasmic adaptor subunit [Bacteroidota bacterium]
MNRKKIFIAGGATVGVVLVLLAIFVFSGEYKKDDSALTTSVKQGQFEVVVTTTGELQAKESEEIRGPEGLRSRSLGLREVKILDLVDEGTVVDSGDYVATLDKTEAMSKLEDVEDELEKKKSEYIKAKLDTAMELKELRNQLIDKEYAVEESEIQLKQSKYEPPATKRQAKIDHERTERELRQARENYSLKVEQAKAKMREVSINLGKQRRIKKEMEQMLEDFKIHAPQNGMVIYKKGYNGKKRKEGSTISPWNLTVATLPDLSTLVSKTYVNEIDISQVKRKQNVKIQVDAFPIREYDGKVSEVANIGQELKSTRAKVFEVDITLNETDSLLRPSMTTSNQIITSVYEDVKYLPLEAVFTEDNSYFVYTLDNKKKEVEAGESNENHIIIEGLPEGEKVHLNVPENAENFGKEPLK